MRPSRRRRSAASATCSPLNYNVRSARTHVGRARHHPAPRSATNCKLAAPRSPRPAPKGTAGRSCCALPAIISARLRARCCSWTKCETVSTSSRGKVTTKARREKTPWTLGRPAPTESDVLRALEAAHPDLAPQTDAVSSVARAVLPLVFDGRALGGLVSDVHEPHAFTKSEPFLRTLAALCAASSWSGAGRGARRRRLVRSVARQVGRRPGRRWIARRGYAGDERRGRAMPEWRRAPAGNESRAERSGFGRLRDVRGASVSSGLRTPLRPCRPSP